MFGLEEDSPYATAGLRSIAVMEESEKDGYDPVVLARLVLKILDKKRLRARYDVGPRMQLLLCACACLPFYRGESRNYC
ncbi:hypothetical protein MASR2M48_08100 [Spirochaetota bacterium]